MVRTDLTIASILVISLPALNTRSNLANLINRTNLTSCKQTVDAVNNSSLTHNPFCMNDAVHILRDHQVAREEGMKLDTPCAGYASLDTVIYCIQIGLIITLNFHR